MSAGLCAIGPPLEPRSVPVRLTDRKQSTSVMAGSTRKVLNPSKVHAPQLPWSTTVVAPEFTPASSGLRPKSVTC